MFNTSTNKQTKVLISMTTIIIVLSLLVIPVTAQPPSLPATYYGLVQINGEDAPVNTTIIAKINGIEKGRVTTTEIGKYIGLGVYGDASDTGKTVQFYVDGVLAPQTTVYSVGAVQEINLSVIIRATYHGSVKINDADAPVNTTIIAKINGIEKGRITTTEIGKYSGLAVYGDASDTGKTVQFYIDGILAPQTTVYYAGAVQEINLLVTKEIIGDFNGNGRVDIGDATYVAYMVAGKITPDLSADFNGNGRVDIGDATKIAYFVVGKISAL